MLCIWFIWFSCFGTERANHPHNEPTAARRNPALGLTSYLEGFRGARHGGERFQHPFYAKRA